jgi:hypothetical protein
MQQTPDFVIIGAMKCATSTLHAQLQAQAGISMSEPKEPNYFSDDDRFQLGWDWYMRHFSSKQPHDLVGDASTHYTKLPTYTQTVNRIHDAMPDCKFIYIMRHPLERSVSHYIHDWTEGKICCSYDQAIERHPELIEYGLYAKQLEPYMQTFGKEKILPVFFRRLQLKPQEELERICKFIGYDKKPKWSSQFEQANVSRNRLRKSALREFITNTPVLGNTIRKVIPQKFKAQIKSRWQLTERPAPSDHSMKRLTEIFNQDLCQLGSLLNINLTINNFNRVTTQPGIDWAGINNSQINPE